MRIAFFDVSPRSYVVESAWAEPMGGTESGLCYLSAELVQQGHDVFLINRCETAQISRGVTCIPLSQALEPEVYGRIAPDAVVLVNGAANGPAFRQVIGKCPMVFWTGHAHDQPSVQPLQDPAVRDAFDGFAMVSDWQKNRYVETFGVAERACGVLRNAISPAFEYADKSPQALLERKHKDTVFTYTSTPFRGLDVLLELWPAIRQRESAATLRVHSSMRVYDHAPEQDESEFGDLYERCRQMEGVEYRGSVPQPELAESLLDVSCFAYPNTFEETSCIAVMEAMASGAFVITSDIGALPETTAGFASLVSWDEPRKYAEQYFGRVFDFVDLRKNGEQSTLFERLTQQIEFVRRHYVWSVRAKEWVDWLSSLPGPTS